MGGFMPRWSFLIPNAFECIVMHATSEFVCKGLHKVLRCLPATRRVYRNVVPNYATDNICML